MAKHHASGGAEKGALVEGPKPKIDARTPKDDAEMKEASEEKETFKRGGAAKHKKRKHGGHVDGEKPHMRLDKRAAGGKVGGHSPFSHAATVKGRPGGEYDGQPDKEAD